MSAKFGELVKLIAEAIKGSKTSAYDTQAQVRRVDGDTVWVHIPGGVDETPVKKTIDAKAGDTVQVRVGGGRAWLTGNQTAPPTDDRVAHRAVQLGSSALKVAKSVEKRADDGEFDGKDGEPGQDGTVIDEIHQEWCFSTSASTFTQASGYDWQTTIPTYVSGLYYWMRTVTVDDDGNEIYSDPVYDVGTQLAAEANVAATTAASAASTAEGIANQALGIAQGTENYFWHDSSGAHVSDTSGTVASGQSMTMASSGTVIMRNGKLVTSWTGTSHSDAALNFYDCSNASADTGDLIASYSRAGITLYISNNMAMSLTSSGLSFYQGNSGNTLMASYSSTGAYFYVAGVKRSDVTSAGLKVYGTDGSTVLASFGTTIQLGKSNDDHVNVSDGGMSWYYRENSSDIRFGAIGKTANSNDDYFFSVEGIRPNNNVENVRMVFFSNNEVSFGTWNSLHSSFYKALTINSSSSGSSMSIETPKIIAGNIDYGTKTGITIPASGYVDVSITFNKTFPSKPKVVVTFSDDAPSSAAGFGATSATVFTDSSLLTTGCKVRLFNNTTSQRTPDLNWIAIG